MIHKIHKVLNIHLVWWYTDDFVLGYFMFTFGKFFFSTDIAMQN